jgi:hypothetical protein
MKVISWFRIEGKEYAICEAEEVFPAIEYLDDGYSVDVKHGCCYRSLMIDNLLDAAMMSGDPIKEAVAASMPRWFALWIEDRAMGDDIFQLMLDNWNRSYSWNAMRFGNFYVDDVKVPDVSMVRKGFNMPRMYLSLQENFGLHFAAEVRAAKYKASQGVNIADLYRKK